MSEQLTWAAHLFLRWLSASDPAAVETLFQRAYESAEEDLSCLIDCEAHMALREHLPGSLREILIAWIEDLDRLGDDLNQPPRTAEELHRCLCVGALCSIDCQAVAQKLLSRRGKWAPAKVDDASD
jgi:hypothetical protein